MKSSVSIYIVTLETLKLCLYGVHYVIGQVNKRAKKSEDAKDKQLNRSATDTRTLLAKIRACHPGTRLFILYSPIHPLFRHPGPFLRLRNGSKITSGLLWKWHQDEWHYYATLQHSGYPWSLRAVRSHCTDDLEASTSTLYIGFLTIFPGGLLTPTACNLMQPAWTWENWRLLWSWSLIIFRFVLQRIAVGTTTHRS